MILDHLGVVVSDCVKSERFYCDGLGCTLSEHWQTPELKAVNLHCGGIIIELLQYVHPPQQTIDAGVINHLAFSVTDIDAQIERLTKMGAAFETAAPKILASGKKIIFFHGPDGERIELVQNI
ncbi:MAG TPA: VOC family protein [Syntrophomonas sp.]|nr:VOC family protein [Syntrophomonas sp.]